MERQSAWPDVFTPERQQIIVVIPCETVVWVPILPSHGKNDIQHRNRFPTISIPPDLAFWILLVSFSCCASLSFLMVFLQSYYYWNLSVKIKVQAHFRILQLDSDLKQDLVLDPWALKMAKNLKAINLSHQPAGCTSGQNSQLVTATWNQRQELLQ